MRRMSRQQQKAMFAKKGFVSSKRGTIVTRPFKKRLKGMHLPIETTVYVPSTEFDKPVTEKAMEGRVKDTRRTLSDLFGGYTSVDSSGGWVERKTGKKAKVIKEPIVKVTSFASVNAFEKNNTKLRNWLKRKQKDWKQFALSYEHEGDLYLIQ